MFVGNEFYYIRHGQTDHNNGILENDNSDISLNGVGREQAKKIEPVISKLPVQTVCFSPLKRARETKEIVAQKLQVPHREIIDLAECTYEIWNQMSSLGRPQAHLISDENVVAFMNRAKNGINQALSQSHPVLIIAHGGVHWAICCLMGIEDHDWLIDNCVPVRFFLGAEGKWTAQKVSCF